MTTDLARLVDSSVGELTALGAGRQQRKYNNEKDRHEQELREIVPQP